MNDLTTFKIQNIKYTLIIAVIFEAGSIPVLGFRAEYLCGLLAGTAVSILSMFMMVVMSERVLASGQKWMASLGYVIRLPIYGAVFLICLKVGGLITAVACLLGFITGTVAVIYIYGIKTKFSKAGTGRK
jgi:hypothetical protein